MKKSAISSCILVKHLTESVDIYLPFLTDIINQFNKNGLFPNELKLAEDKINYRLVSLLPHMSKVLKRITFNQISEYIETFLSNLQTGFRKNHNMQHCLLKMSEK